MKPRKLSSLGAARCDVEAIPEAIDKALDAAVERVEGAANGVLNVAVLLDWIVGVARRSRRIGSLSRPLRGRPPMNSSAKHGQISSKDSSPHHKCPG